MRRLLLTFLFGLWGFFLAPAQSSDYWSAYRDTTRGDSIRLLALDEIVWITLSTDPDSGLALARLQLREATRMSQAYWKGYAYKNMARYYMERTAMDSANRKLSQAAREFEQGGYPSAVGHTWSEMARISMMSGDYARADSLWQECLELGKEIEDENLLAIIYGNLGSLYRRKAAFPKALDYVHEALLIYERQENPRLLGTAYRTIGTIHQEMLEFEEAIRAYRQSQAHFREAGAKNDEGIGLINIGEAYKQLGRPEEARACLDSALAIFTELNSPRYIAIVEFQLASTLQALGEYEEAEVHARKSVEMLENSGQERLLAYARLTLGLIFNETGRARQAVSLCEKSLSAFKSIDSPQDRMAACQCLYLAHKKSGNSARALAYHESYISLRDSNNSEENTREIARLEAKLDYDRQAYQDSLSQAQFKFEKEAEVARERTLSRVGFAGAGVFLLAVIATLFVLRNNQRKNHQLQEQNQLIEQQRAEAERQNDQKALLLREIHHRVKNNLQVVSSLLDLQVNRLQDQAAADAVIEGRTRVKSIALIHEKLYQTEDLARIDFEEYARQLTSELSAAFGNQKNIQTEVSGEGLSLDIDTAVPLGLILNELVANAYKHAFREMEEGKIGVNLQKLPGGGYQLKVSDNGSGLPEKFDPRKTPSLGMRLVQGLTRQLKGKFAFESKEGAVFTIQFKEEFA